MMLMVAEMNRYGHLEVDIVNKRLRKRIARELGRRLNESILYIQQDNQVSDFIANYVPKNQKKFLNDGWPVRFRLSNDIINMIAGE